MNIITDISDALGLTSTFNQIDEEEEEEKGNLGGSSMTFMNKFSTMKDTKKKKITGNTKSKLMEPLKFEKDFFR